MICVIADVSLRAGSRDAFLAAAREVVAATRSEPGCIRYDLTQDVENSEQVTFVEEWQSREALAAHFETEHMAQWRVTSAPFVVGRTIKVLHVGDVELL